MKWKTLLAQEFHLISICCSPGEHLHSPPVLFLAIYRFELSAD